MSWQQALDGRADFVAAVQQSVRRALAQRSRTMVWADADFADWPLDDAAMLAVLTEWLRLPQRQWRLLAAEPERLRRRARFMALYGPWTHAIAVSAAAEEDIASLPCLLVAEGAGRVEVLDKLHWRGQAGDDPLAMRAGRERLDALLQRSTPALPYTPLGL